MHRWDSRCKIQLKNLTNPISSCGLHW